MVDVYDLSTPCFSSLETRRGNAPNKSILHMPWGVRCDDTLKFRQQELFAFEVLSVRNQVVLGVNGVRLGKSYATGGKRRAEFSSRPIRLFLHMPLFVTSPEWGEAGDFTDFDTTSTRPHCCS